MLQPVQYPLTLIWFGLVKYVFFPLHFIVWYFTRKHGSADFVMITDVRSFTSCLWLGSTLPHTEYNISSIFIDVWVQNQMTWMYEWKSSAILGMDDYTWTLVGLPLTDSVVFCGRLHNTHLSPIPIKLGDSSSRWHLSDLGPLRDTHLAVFRLKLVTTTGAAPSSPSIRWVSPSIVEVTHLTEIIHFFGHANRQ